MKAYITLLNFLLFLNVMGQEKKRFNSFSYNRNIPVIKGYNKKDSIIMEPKKEIIPIKEKPKNVTISRLPTNNFLVTSKYGYRFHPIHKQRKFHYGIDIKTNKSKIYSVLNGVVIKSEYDSKLGHYIKIKHNNIFTIYGHLSKRLVKKGELIKAGDIIGISGSSGNSTGDHLHFAVKHNNQYLDPQLLIDRII